MATPLQSWLTSVGLAKETTLYTPVAPTTSDQFISIQNPKPEDVIETILDNGYRERGSADQGYQQGFRYAKYGFDSYWHPEVCGNWLMGIMGTDGFAAGSTHPFTVLNTGRTASYTVQDFYGFTGTHSRSYAGMFFESVSMSGSGDKSPLKATVSLSGGKVGALVAQPTSTYVTSSPFIPWQGALTLNSVSSTKLLSIQLDLKRTITPIAAMGSQDPSDCSVGQLTCTGKVVFAIADDTEYLLYSTTGQAAFPFSLVFTSGTNTLTIVMTKCQFETPTVFDRSQDYVTVSASFRGIDNTTDGGACKITLVGGKGSAY